MEMLFTGGSNLTGELSFLCDLQSYDAGDTSLNCSDYCGTLNEECNSTSIGSAQCSDVECFGAGEPTCTSLCRLDYSSCSASASQISFELDLQTDDNGWHITWEINDSTGTVWESAETYRSGVSVTEFRCMDIGCYSFELSDSGGDRKQF